jgi:2-oxoglutarate/2-oxoacid ferredoxin oxidoreductase subunit beta
VLRAAADHKGAAFIEIYQNCPIFNDDAFAPLKEPDSRDERLVRLEHGERVTFGAGRAHGLRFNRYGGLEPVDISGADEDALLVHDAHAADPSYAFALSRLDGSDFAHTPIGVFRQVQRPSYDELMAAQLESARQRQGEGDLAALLAGPDTWQVN